MHFQVDEQADESEYSFHIYLKFGGVNKFNNEFMKIPKLGDKVSSHNRNSMVMITGASSRNVCLYVRFAGFFLFIAEEKNLVFKMP